MISNERYGKMTVRIRIILFVLLVVDTIATFLEYLLLKAVIDSEYEWYDPQWDTLTTTNDITQGILGIAFFIVLLLAAIFYVLWFRRAYNNLRSIGLELRYKSWWTFWGWIIPIAWFFVPYQIMKELHKKTVDILKANGQDATFELPQIKIWWALFIITSYLDNIFMRLMVATETLEDFLLVDLIYLSSNVLTIIGLAFSLHVIKNYRQMETALHNGMERGEIRLEKRLTEE